MVGCYSNVGKETLQRDQGTISSKSFAEQMRLECEMFIFTVRVPGVTFQFWLLIQASLHNTPRKAVGLAPATGFLPLVWETRVKSF